MVEASSPPPWRVLFLCTGNSARSILAEYLLRSFGASRFAVASAGAAPTGRVHSEALRTLAEVYGIDASEAASQSIADYSGTDFDLVVTVCDHARDACPVWPGAAIRAHWSSPDPAAASGSEAHVAAVFRAVARQIEGRVRGLCALDFESSSAAELAASVAALGEDAPAPAA